MSFTVTEAVYLVQMHIHSTVTLTIFRSLMIQVPIPDRIFL